MNAVKVLFVTVLVCALYRTEAQQNTITPDLSKVSDGKTWQSRNRKVTFDNAVHLDARPGDGIVWLKDLTFGNGRIDLDIRGKDLQGQSFVGVAFHGINEQTYDAVYFRPFNFRNPQRNGNSVQYISHPDNSWDKLRAAYPGKYEHAPNPVPDPSEWFHVTVIVGYPVVTVFVNHSNEPSLTVNQLSSQKQGWIGFWTGNNSDGDFRNLKITPM